MIVSVTRYEPRDLAGSVIVFWDQEVDDILLRDEVSGKGGLRIERGNLSKERKKPGKKAQAKRRRNKRCIAGEFVKLVDGGGIVDG